MKKFTIVLFAAILSFAFLVAPGILEARGGHGGHGGHGGGGGHHSGFHGGHRGGSHGGYRGGFHGGGFYGGPRYYGGFGSGAAYYLAPWGWYYPGYEPSYYPDYYYNVPPEVYDQPPAIEAPPPEYIEPPPATQGVSPGYVLPPPPTTSQIPPNINQRRCQFWGPTGESHNESRWNPQKEMMENVSVPNFAWQDHPCE